MKKMTGILILAVLKQAFAAEVPPYPGIESWEFRRELAEPERLEPVSTNDVVFVRGKVEGYESYRIDVDSKGKVVITAEDDEGLRRAVYYYEDRVRAGDLKSCVRKPWVKNRIARCFFGPIKRPPLYHDELMDDIDYYPLRVGRDQRPARKVSQRRRFSPRAWPGKSGRSTPKARMSLTLSRPGCPGIVNSS